MLLRRINEHVKAQNWFAVFLDFLIVVLGVFIGIQVANWNEVRQERQREVHYLDRLDQEFDVIRGRLASGVDVFEGSVRSIDLLLTTHRMYSQDSTAVLPDGEALGTAVTDITSGRIPAGSPAAFREMVSNGALETLQSDELRQALFAYDEFSTIARDGWRTIRDEQHVAANRVISFVDLNASKFPTDASNFETDGIEIVNFQKAAFLQSDDIPGHLSVLLRAQVNQYLLLSRQLELAQEIEALIAMEKK